MWKNKAIGVRWYLKPSCNIRACNAMFIILKKNRLKKINYFCLTAWREGGCGVKYRCNEKPPPSSPPLRPRSPLLQLGDGRVGWCPRPSLLLVSVRVLRGLQGRRPLWVWCPVPCKPRWTQVHGQGGLDCQLLPRLRCEVAVRWTAPERGLCFFLK